VCVCACVLEEVCLHVHVFVCETGCVSLFEIGLFVVMFHACASRMCVCCFVCVCVWLCKCVCALFVCVILIVFVCFWWFEYALIVCSNCGPGVNDVVCVCVCGSVYVREMCVCVFASAGALLCVC